MASGRDQSKAEKPDSLSRTISWLRKWYTNFTSGVKKDKEVKEKPRGRGKKKIKTNLELLKTEPDIMLKDKDKIRTSVRIYRDHPPDFPTSEQIKARLIAAEKYYGVPRGAQPIGEGMVFEEDADDVVEIRPCWAYILERPLVEQYVLMSNYIRRLSAMSAMNLPDDQKYIEDEFRDSDDEPGDGMSFVTGQTSLSYLGSMYIRPATSPSDKEEDETSGKENEKTEAIDFNTVPVVEPAAKTDSEDTEPAKITVDDFYPSLEDDTSKSSYEKHEVEVTCPPRTSLVVLEKDFSHESSVEKASGSRDSFLDFRNMRVEEIPERQFQVVMERTTEIKANRLTVDESLTLNQREDYSQKQKVVRFICPSIAGGGVSRIAKIFEGGSAITDGTELNRMGMISPDLKRDVQRQEPIQIHDGNLLSRKSASKRRPEIETIPLPSFSGSESGNDSPNEGLLSD